MDVLTLVHSKPEWPGRVVDLSVLVRRWMLFCCVFQPCYCSWEWCGVRVGLTFSVACVLTQLSRNPTLSTRSALLHTQLNTVTQSTYAAAGSRLGGIWYQLSIQSRIHSHPWVPQTSTSCNISVPKDLLQTNTTDGGFHHDYSTLGSWCTQRSPHVSTQFKHTCSILVPRDWLFKIHNFDDTHREWELFYRRWDGELWANLAVSPAWLQ